MDELDTQIVLRLQRNGRESNSEIARNLRVSEGTVRRRIRKLVESGLIEVTAIPNLARMGYHSPALIGLQVEPGMVDPVADALAATKDVHFVVVTTGPYDVFVWTVLPSPEDLGLFLKNMVAKVPGVRRTETFVNLEIKKRTFGRLE